MNQEALEKYKKQIEEEIEKNREQLRKIDREIDKTTPLLYDRQLSVRATVAMALLFFGDCALAYIVHTLAITNIGVIGTVLWTVAPLSISYLVATGIEKKFYSHQKENQEAKTDVERHQDVAMMEVEKNQLINRNGVLYTEQKEIEKEMHLLSQMEENYTIIPKEQKNNQATDNTEKIENQYTRLDDFTRRFTLARYFHGDLFSNIGNVIAIGLGTVMMAMLSLFLICVPSGSIFFSPISLLASSFACAVVGGVISFKAFNNRLKASRQMEKTYGKEYMGKTTDQMKYQEEIANVQHQILSLRTEKRHQIITQGTHQKEKPKTNEVEDTMKHLDDVEKVQEVDEQVEKDNPSRGKVFVKK